MKRIIIYLTNLSLLNLVGCYSQQQIAPNEFNCKNNDDIKVVVNDSSYIFKSGDYYCKDDTLFGTVSQPLDKSSTYKYSISIPVKSIPEIEVNSVDGLLTIISVGVVTVILLLLWSISIKWD